MFSYLSNLPEQFQESLGKDLDYLKSYRKEYSNIVVSGLGGSAIGGDILRNYALQRCQLPLIVNRDYDIPAFVGSKTLFLAVSYSGNTEETLSAYQQAKSKGASIICITCGGKLNELASRDGFAVINIASGLVPRAATGYLFAAVALVMEKLSLIKDVTVELEETISVLEQVRANCHPGVSIDHNQAKQIAQIIKDRIPVIWGTAGFSETAAMRWKGQINENAKSPAYFNVFPELNHNEIVGFEVPEDLLSRIIVVILRDKYDRPQVNKRIQITADLLKNKVGRIVEVNSIGESYLPRFYSLTYVGDYVSVYLAQEYGINPTPVKVIDFLKTELAK